MTSRRDTAAIDPDIVLSASEIASYAFCPAAWHLQRCGAARSSASILKLENGTLAHRRIAIHATRTRRLQRVLRLTLLFIIALVVGLLLEILSAGGLVRV